MRFTRQTIGVHFGVDNNRKKGREMTLKISKSRLCYPHKRSALKYLVQSPSLAFGMFQDPSRFYFSKTLERVLELNIVSCLYEFLPEKFLNHLKEKKFSDGVGVRLILYSIIRKYKPEIVIETGVAHGASSAFILCAMRENAKGHLYSIDLPPYNASHTIEDGYHVLDDGGCYTVAGEFVVGDLVPEYLKENWTLILGDARKELPILLKKTDKISIFFHDSLHTYEHMMFEYETAWPHITEDGLLLSHDVLWNEAFLRFSKKVNSEFSIYYSLGVIKKN
jgi:predicted O-methyltransferase YrrM